MTFGRGKFILGAVLLLSMISNATTSADAAGPLGHFLLGKQLIDNIKNNRCEVDPELKNILKHPDARRAFEGGCVAPDIAESKSHYNQTADLAAKMLKDARTRYKGSRDQATLEQARRELAFAYGWYSHCATDFVTHPKVNAYTGDTFRFNNASEQKKHALQEAQMTAYLRETIGKDPYDVYIPFEFLSKHLNVTVSDLKAGDQIVRAKVKGELVDSSLFVKLDDKIKDSWRRITLNSLRESELYLKNPSAMQNWDLDCGKISTREFDDLRKLAITANRGKLPDGWGRNYLAWYQKTKGYSQAEQLKILQTLVSPAAVATASAGSGAKSRPAKTQAVTSVTSPRQPLPAMAWVRTEIKEFVVSDGNYQNKGGKGKYTLTWDSHGCSTPGCPGEVLAVEYACSEPPAMISSDEKITLQMTGAIIKNTTKHYSCNTTMDVFFDRAEIDPGFYGGGPGVGGLKISCKDYRPPAPLTASGSPGKGYEGIGKMALIVAMYNGRCSGTKYIYEWKAPK